MKMARFSLATTAALHGVQILSQVESSLASTGYALVAATEDF